MDFTQGNISWVIKSKGYYSGKADIDIHISKSKGKERMAITIRNGCHKKFDSEFIVFGIDGDRLWFAPADASNGYKMSIATSHSDNRYVQCTDETLVTWAHDHVGNYRLSKDVESGLHFVDARRVNK